MRGEPRLELRGRWETRPFERPFYWALRVGRSTERGGWELELVHHKIYLENPTPQVSHFEITHGFNLATVHRIWIRGGWVLRAGAGAVIAHTESTVRGVSTGRRADAVGGYEVAGPAFQAGVGRRFALAGNLFGTLEAKATWGRASVTIAGGKARTDNLAAHGLFGLGWRFR